MPAVFNSFPPFRGNLSPKPSPSSAGLIPPLARPACLPCFDSERICPQMLRYELKTDS